MIEGFQGFFSLLYRKKREKIVHDRKFSFFPFSFSKAKKRNERKKEKSKKAKKRGVALIVTRLDRAGP